MTSISADNTPPSTNPENDSRKIVLHVLCPSLPAPNRFTFHDLTLSTTVATLKSRISESVPSRPDATRQRLIYYGKPIANDDLTLQTVLEPVESTEYSIHLVLPPVPVPPTPTPTSASTPSTAQDSRNTMPQNPFHAPRPFSDAQGPESNTSGMRFRGHPAQPPGLSEADIGLALRRNIDAMRNIDAIRRQVHQERESRFPGQPRTEAATSPFSNPLFPQQNLRQPLPNSPPNPLHLAPGQSGFTTTTRTFTMPSNTVSGSAPGGHDSAGAQLPNESRMRLQILQAQIALCENQMSRGNAPAIEHVIHLRTQLLNILDEQCRNPLIPRDGVVEALLSRVFNLYTRADQHRVTQSRTVPVQSNFPGASSQTTTDTSRAPTHILTSPDGYQALVSSPGGAETIQTSHQAPPMQMPDAAHGHGHPAGLHANPDAPIFQNAVRQAVLNQHAGHQANIGLARNLRRIWLFMRLYLFCYMFSAPGTWTRILFVTLAVLMSLLSETGVPRALYRLIVNPVQRHFETLVHAGPGRNVRPEQRDTDGPAAAQEGGGAAPGVFRAIERSVALFIASLVPGVGERHVEVRNAAEAAERARAEEQRRQEENQEANATQQPGDENTTARPEEGEGEQQATTDHDSQHDTPEHEGRGGE